MYTGDEYCIPFFGIDVWEHAYYLDRKNKRGDYVSDFWTVVDWSLVAHFYDEYASRGNPVPVA
jgi:superoxide dismutase